MALVGLCTGSLTEGKARGPQTHITISYCWVFVTTLGHPQSSRFSQCRWASLSTLSFIMMEPENYLHLGSIDSPRESDTSYKKAHRTVWGAKALSLHAADSDLTRQPGVWAQPKVFPEPGAGPAYRCIWLMLLRGSWPPFLKFPLQWSMVVFSHSGLEHNV